MSRPLLSKEFLQVAGGATLLAFGIIWLGWLGLLCAVGGIVLLAQAAEVQRPGGLKLFGPIMAWELMRQTRKLPLFRFRAGYVFAVALILGLIWLVIIQETPRGKRMTPVQTVQLFSAVFLVLQFLAVVLLTPSMVAGVFTDEKEQRTIDFVLMTDLRTQEIILGKLVARVAIPCMYLLLGLPLMTVLPVIGGVAFSEIVLYSVALFATLGTGVAVSGWASLQHTQTKKAIGAAFGSLIGLQFAVAYLRGLPMFTAYMGVVGWPQALVETTTQVLCLFNPVMALIHVSELSASGVAYEDALWSSVGIYIRLHLLLTLGLVMGMLSELRTVVARAPEVAVKKETEPSILPYNTIIRRPAVSDWPLMWREWYGSRGKPQRQWERVVAQTLFFLSLILIGLLIPLTWLASTALPMLDPFCQRAWSVIALGPMIVAAIAVLAVSNRASFTIARDQEQKILDEVLQTPLDEREILTQKWWGCVGHMRYAYLWAAIVWGMVFFAKPVLAVAILPMIAVAVVHLDFATNLGLYFSTRHATGPKASGWLVGTGMLMNFVIPIPLGLLAMLPALLQVQREPVALGYVAFVGGLAVGISPVAVLSTLGVMGVTVSVANAPLPTGMELASFVLFGIGVTLTTLVYAALSQRLFNATCQLFERLHRPRAERTAPPVEAT